MVWIYAEILRVSFIWVSFVLDSRLVLMQMPLSTTEIRITNFWSTLCISIRYYCNECAQEPFLFSLFWVLLTSLDMYMSWIRFDLWVGTTKLGWPCRFDPWTWSPLLTSVSCSLTLNSVLSPGSMAVVLLSICIYVYSCLSNFAYPRPTRLVCSHHINDGGFNLRVVAILLVFVPWLPYMFYIAYVL